MVMFRIQGISAAVVAAAVMCTLVCSCSKSNQVTQEQPPAEQATIKHEDAGQAVVNETAETQNDEQKTEDTPAEPSQDKAVHEAKVWMPAAVDLDKIHEMDAKSAEKAILDSFSANADPDSPELIEWRKKADEGDDQAREKVALAYMHLPATDSRHSTGLDYLKKIEHIASAEAYYLRGIAEYDNNGNNVEIAKPYLSKALDMDYEPAIRYLRNNMIFDLNDEAMTKLSAIYMARSDNPETFLEYMTLQDFVPDENVIAQRLDYIEKGISRNFPEAYYVKALLFMDTGKKAEGLELLKKSADLGSSDGNALLASMYMAANGASNAEEALENTGLPLDDEQFKILKSDLAKASDKIDFIDSFAKNAKGNIMACGVLMEHAASEDESPQVAKARTGVIDCINQYLEKNHSRSDCEEVYSMTSYDNDSNASFDTIFSDEERQSIGQHIIQCLNTALNQGDDYTDEGPAALSTALRISHIFAHDNVFNIPEDEGRELQYLVYAAHDEDPIAQSILAQDYLAGKHFKSNMERACDWGNRALKSTFCTDFCRESEGVTSCGTCDDAREVVAEACK